MHAIFPKTSYSANAEEAQNMKAPRKHSRQRGMAIIFYAVMLFFVIGCVGLAVDVGTIYMIKARLSSAVDAAALAAGRSVNLALDVATANTNAVSTANQFFTANFPNGYFNSLGTPTVTPILSQETDANNNPSGVLDIKVTASVTAPTYFMNIFTVHSIVVAATGTASRRGLVLVLVLDQSSSMGNGPGSPCAAMITAAQSFMTNFSPYDEVGLVTFDITAHMMDAPTTTRTQVSTDIGNINCNSNTNTISALELAYQQIKNANLPLALNTIVLFTDGSPNGVTADFPARASLDNRWGPALGSPAPPAQSGSTYGQTNSCGDVGPAHTYGTSSVNEEAVCVNMPKVCTDSAATLYGTLAQWGSQDSYGASTYGLAPPTDGETATTSLASCSPSPGAGTNIRQFIAYIPDTDKYGNDLKNGVASTAATGTAQGGYVSRLNWLFQVNQLCNASITPSCTNTGDFWAGHAVGSGSNIFTSGPYAGHIRPDQPNSVVAAAMNGAISEAYRIKNDMTYNPVIHTIYLTGNGTDAVDREFLAIIANAQQITPLPYDPNTFTPYANPAFQTTHETGKYLVTSDRNMLTNLFTQLASEALRLSK
jgi:Flp pilus assembly protein TadG